MRARAWVALVAALAAGAGHAQLRPLFVIPVDSASAVPLQAGGAARVRLTGAKGTPALAELLGVTAPPGATSFEYVIDRYPQLETRTPRTWLEPTFVIDFEEPAVAALAAEIGGLEGKPTRAAIVEFVARIIDDKVPRAWDLASVVAERRQGDCTEHAVLTAALARSYGIPARVAVGVALLSDGAGHFAGGHAWAELREGDQWVVADAALFGVAQQVRHVPTGIMEEEGPGYSMGLVSLMQHWILRVEVLGPESTG
jgi:transglutaminase-like putative cysteine protease